MTLTIDQVVLSELPISVDPGVCGGSVVFKGTRVPVSALFNNLPEMDIDGFVDCFPTVKKEQAIAVLEYCKRHFFQFSKAPYEIAAR